MLHLNSSYSYSSLSSRERLELIKRTLLMHEVMPWDLPELVECFLHQGAILNGHQRFPPFIQQLTFFTPHFVQKFNQKAKTDQNIYQREFNEKYIQQILHILFQRKLQLYDARVWVQKDGVFKRTDIHLVEALCASIRSKLILELIVRYTLSQVQDNEKKKSCVMKIVHQAVKYANIELLRYMFNKYQKLISYSNDNMLLRDAAKGGSLEAVKLTLANLETHFTRPDLLVERMQNSYDEVRFITKLPKAICYEENHQFPDILDFLKQNLSKYASKILSNSVPNSPKESKDSKSSKSAKVKKTNSEVPVKKKSEMNGGDRTYPLKSDNMAQDVKNMEQIINQLRASKRNESADDLEALNAQSNHCRDAFEQTVINQTLRKERGVQTCVLTKEKQIQTTGDHTLSKQIESKDRRIVELEDALAKLRKKEEKMSKVEKELADARLKCQRQTKEIGNLESFKKNVENQSAEIENLWESNEKLEHHYEVEKNRSAELERRCHDIQNQLHQLKMEQNKNETRRNLDQRNEYEMKYRKKADRVNEFKEALRDVYKHNIALEAALKTQPNRLRINQMVDDLREFKLERERSNDFEQNGSVTNYSALLQENNFLKNKNEKFKKELKQNERFKEQIERLETAGVTSCRICELDYEPIGDRKRCKLACSHVICEICAKDWLSRNGACPFCKHPFNHIEPIHLY